LCQRNKALSDFQNLTGLYCKYCFLHKFIFLSHPTKYSIAMQMKKTGMLANLHFSKNEKLTKNIHKGK